MSGIYEARMELIAQVKGLISYEWYNDEHPDSYGDITYHHEKIDKAAVHLAQAMLAKHWGKDIDYGQANQK